MIELLKHTYLMDVKMVDKELAKLWKRYQSILKKPNWEDLNEARGILYLTYIIYCEKIAVEAIEKRLHLLKKKYTILDFLSIVDGGEPKELEKLRVDPMFTKLEDFYRVVKRYKNGFVSGEYYLDEEKFIKLYNKYNPDKKSKMGYRGRFKK